MGDENSKHVEAGGASTAEAQEVAAQDARVAIPTWRGRALIGWMAVDRADAMLVGFSEAVDQDERRGRAERARAAIAAREAGVDQERVLEDPPAVLDAFIRELERQDTAAPLLAEGWAVKVADLSRVCSLQQHVHSEQAAERVASIDSDDLTSIAAVTLPAAAELHLPVAFDEGRKIWMVSGANPNLRILGPFQGDAAGRPALGFVVGVLPSFVQVARHHGRYVLRDGYHRAFGLLSRGVTKAPVLYRDFGVGDLSLPPGLFQTDVYLGPRPLSRPR